VTALYGLARARVAAHGDVFVEAHSLQAIQEHLKTSVDRKRSPP